MKIRDIRLEDRSSGVSHVAGGDDAPGPVADPSQQPGQVDKRLAAGAGVHPAEASGDDGSVGDLRLWDIYRRRRAVASANRMLLSQALSDYCELQWGYGGREIADAFQTKTFDQDELTSLISSIDFLAGLILDGTLRCWCRPFGGGAPAKVATLQWEIDDFLPRFANSAFDPVRWHSAAAEPTHWLFIDADDFQRFMEAWGATDRAESEEFQSPLAHSAPARISDIQDEEFCRLPEVIRLTGLSRSTIYHKIAKGTFPEPKRLGSRLSMWRRGHIRAWLNDPA